MTAIVGASGSGKTTLVKLMLGYYPLESGRIMISGANIEEYNMRWWREQCGVVMERGKVVECGTHQTLTALHGIYYKLVKNQLELGL